MHLERRRSAYTQQPHAGRDMGFSTLSQSAYKSFPLGSGIPVKTVFARFLLEGVFGPQGK